MVGFVVLTAVGYGAVGVIGGAVLAVGRAGSAIGNRLRAYSLRGGVLALCVETMAVLVMGIHKIEHRGDVYLVEDALIVFFVGAGIGVPFFGMRLLVERVLR
jgi:hypothetical protein